MRKYRVSRRQYTVVSIVFLLSTVYGLLFTNAQAASPSFSPNSLTEFQQKVEIIKKDAASKAAVLKSTVSKTIQNKAFIGTITQINSKQIILQAAKGPRTVNTDEYTIFQDSSKKNIYFKDLKKDDFLISLGDVDDNQVLKAKKIIRSKLPVVSEKYVVWGQIQSILVGNLSLLKNDSQKITISTDGGTQMKFGNQEITLQNLKTANFIISVGSKLDNNSASAQFIYLLNPKGDLKIEKISTASATPSASSKIK